MDKITQLLKEQKSADGISLFAHLQELLQKIIYSPNEYSSKFEFFELFSDFTKKNSFIYKTPLSDTEVNAIRERHGEYHEYIAQALRLLKEAPRQQKLQGVLFPNFLADSYQLQWAGVSFSEEEAYRIQLSVRKLAETTKARELRFWGKILASQKDYYIAEGVVSNIFADKLPQNAEQRGEGANYYTYFVTHDLLNEWLELPLVTPEQVQLARQIKYVFTGNLNLTINNKTYPHFPGKEKHLLRAQIARISAATVLVPRGLYRVNEENAKVIEFEEEPFKLPQEFAELKNPENWVHQQSALLGLGRTSHWVDPKLSEEEKEQRLSELQEKDAEIERLKGITEEKSPYGKEGAEEEEGSNWLIREFNQIKDESVASYAVVAFKNLTWPGSYLVSSLKGWVNIYVGYGLKVNQSPFLPVQPDKVLDEGEDQDEYPEPNPSKPIEVIEPDSSDDERKKEENAEAEEDG